MTTTSPSATTDATLVNELGLWVLLLEDFSGRPNGEINVCDGRYSRDFAEARAARILAQPRHASVRLS